MLWACCLILWPLRSFLMCLRAFVFHPNCDSFFQRFSGTTRFTGSQKLMAYFKQNVPISSFAICQKGYGFGMVDKFCHGLNGFFEKGLVFFAAVHFPNESTGSMHKDNRPSRRFFRRNIFMNFRIKFITLNDHFLDERVRH